MTTNINELYATFAQAINQNTQALQQGFVMAMQQQQAVAPAPTDAMVQQQVAAMMPNLMNQSPAPVISPEPVVEDVIQDPSSHSFISSNKHYAMHVQFNKPCGDCPFASDCSIRTKGKISSVCNVSHMKEAAESAGELYLKVIFDKEKMTKSFELYKDDMFIGSVAKNKENKSVLSELEREDYEGKTLVLSTVLMSSVKDSVFTKLQVEIANILGNEAPAVTYDTTIEFPEIESPEPPLQPEPATLDLGEMATLDLGELVLPI